MKTFKEISYWKGYSLQNDEIKELSTLLKFINKAKNIKISLPHFSFTTNLNFPEKFEIYANQICLIFESVLTPIKFSFNTIRVTEV